MSRKGDALRLLERALDVVVIRHVIAADRIRIVLPFFDDARNVGATWDELRPVLRSAFDGPGRRRRKGEDPTLSYVQTTIKNARYKKSRSASFDLEREQAELARALGVPVPGIQSSLIALIADQVVARLSAGSGESQVVTLIAAPQHLTAGETSEDRARTYRNMEKAIAPRKPSDGTRGSPQGQGLVVTKSFNRPSRAEMIRDQIAAEQDGDTEPPISSDFRKERG